MDQSAAAASSSSSAAIAGASASLAPTAVDISPSISERTSSRLAVNRTHLDGVGTPPTTPPPKSRRKRNKGKEPAVGQAPHREQLRRESSDGVRHSHGLSWSSTTRDSVVDNLLLSLDGLSSGDAAGAFGMDDDRAIERERYGAPQMPDLPSFPASRPMQRARGHTYSSSVSSDSRYSGSAKGRRSNSSTNFDTITSRTRRPGIVPGRGSSDTVRHVRPSHGKSASSDIDSVDYGYSSIVETHKIAFPGRRSMSMDQIYQEPIGPSVLDRGRPVPSVHSKYDANFDAAPEPGVPAGPRKKLNPTATGPVYVNQATTKQSIRKVNTQSDLRSSNKSSNIAIPQHIQEQASDFVRNNSMRGVPSMPLPHEHNAPAPGPGFKKSRKDTPSPHQERPGFFKRVFGQSSRTPSGLQHNAYTYGDGMAASTPVRTQSTASGATTSQVTAGARKSSREQSHPPPALNKKSSSFFRRRKKSDAENIPPPLPMGLPQAIKPPEPSPGVSSLRKVMDPFLAMEGSAPQQTASDRPGSSLTRAVTQDSATEESDLDIFHSGYTPPPDASLGYRDPLTRDAASRPKVIQDMTSSPKMKVKKRRNPDGTLAASAPQDLSGTSFLHEESRAVSSASIGGQLLASAEQAKVSPVSETQPRVDAGKDDVKRASRASTGDRIIASQAGDAVVEQKLPVRNFSEGTRVSHDASEDSWVVVRPSSKSSHHTPEGKKSNYLKLEPTDGDLRATAAAQTAQAAEEPVFQSRKSSLKSPAIYTTNPSITQSPGISSSYHSATSLPLPSVLVEGQPRRSIDAQQTATAPGPDEEGAEYCERARKIYEGDEEDVPKSEAAAWLGEKNTLSMKTLRAYMQLFDFAGKNILTALRNLCDRLLLKGETQQVDRIITALSERWCSCNPNHGFKAQDVVHTIFYSLILLNTDLHMADIGEKMSRSAYVKNTLPTIKRVVADAAPNAFDETRPSGPSSTRPTSPWPDPDATVTPSIIAKQGDTLAPERTSVDGQRPNPKRLSLRPGMFRSESDGWSPDSAGNSSSNALVNDTWSGSLRGWEFEIENVLKSFYAAIRNDPLPLLGGEERSGERTLSVFNQGILKRSNSIVSKAPSENMSFRSKPGMRALTMGWHSRQNRSRPKLYPASTVASSRTSFDDNNSIWSPAQSMSGWSKNSLAKTLTSASMNSLGYHYSPTNADFKHSIGFANALSQAIIREEGGTMSNDGDSMSVAGALLEDESIALEGAPWAKEGLVKHKHHLETVDRKAKERSWVDCFAVICNGKLTLFAFGSSSKSHSIGRNRATKALGGRAASMTATKVGGGDWMENAEELDSFALRHTIASTLPPPGYSKTRPHVWALSLPSGAVHLFQVGTPEIAEEFMTTANYWSARLSKEPLSGSVSNIEYGWSDQVINPALLDGKDSNNITRSPPGSMSNPSVRGHLHSSSSASGPVGRSSLQSSMRGSFDTGFGGSARSRLPGDRIHITDWHPPTQSMMASALSEAEQLQGLKEYVASVEAELEKHNELKHAIELAYSPRHANYNRAMVNWQRKSEYLLREIVKFRTYIDALAAAQKAKERFYAAKSEQETASKGAVSPVDSGRADVPPRPPQTAP